jgi:hypothetical protein
VASKKQRRRREKLQRHEYEYVLETDEGEEVLESPRETEAAVKNGKPAKVPTGPLDRSRACGGCCAGPRSSRR